MLLKNTLPQTQSGVNRQNNGSSSTGRSFDELIAEAKRLSMERDISPEYDPEEEIPIEELAGEELLGEMTDPVKMAVEEEPAFFGEEDFEREDDERKYLGFDNHFLELLDEETVKEETSDISTEEVLYKIFSAEEGGYLGKDSKVDDVLYGKAHTFDPEDNKKFREALNSRNTNDIIITEKQIGEKIREHTKDYGLDPGNVDDRIKFLNIIDNIIDNADEVVIGDNWRGQTGQPVFYIKDKDVVVTMKDDKRFVTVLEGGITNARVKNARK